MSQFKSALLLIYTPTSNRRFLIQRGCNSANVLSVATGLAQEYLSDVYGNELLKFVTCANIEQSEDYKRGIRDRFTTDMGMYIEPNSVQVHLNINSHAAKMFVSKNRSVYKHTAKVTPPPLRFLWHGCNPKNFDEIFRDGFKTSFANMTFNVYGSGIYFATDAKLSSYFVAGKGNDMKPDVDYSIIFAAVTLGTVGIRVPLLGGLESEKTKMAQDLKHPANRNPPVGCDSATGAYLKEIVVYDNMHAFPFAKVVFRLSSINKIPDPYLTDFLNRTYLKSLWDVPIGLGGVYLLEGAGSRAAFLDDMPLVIIENASLVHGWLPSTSADVESETVEEMREKILVLENRVFLLERENEILQLNLAKKNAT